MSVKSEESATPGAGLGEGFKITSKLAVGVVTAPVKDFLLLAYLLHHLAATLRAVNAQLDLIGFSIFTFGVAATG